jgi:HSP20 family protein
VDLKTWTPFPYLDTDWRIDLPRLFRESGAFRPSIDVVRSDDRLMLTAELPGLTADDVEVSLDGDILSIRGEKSDETETEDAERYIAERTFGAFMRQIAVPSGVTADEVDATFEDGVLTVRVDLPEEKADEPKRIPVGTKNGS